MRLRYGPRPYYEAGIRSGLRRGIGAGGGGAPPAMTTALDYVSAAKVLQYVRADLGITLNGADRVAQWDDQSGAGLHYTHATAAQQPLYLPTGFANSTPCLQNDDGNRHMGSSLTLPAPGTTPTWFLVVGEQDAWTSLDSIVSDTTHNGPLVLQTGSSPSVSQGSPTLRNPINWTLGEPRALMAYYSNSSADYLRIGGTTAASGFSVGNQGSVNRWIFGGPTSRRWWGKIAEVLYLNAEPSAGELSDLVAYLSARYGPLLLSPLP